MSEVETPRLTEEAIQQIKARAERWADTIELKDPMSRLVYEDVRALVAEVERLRAEVDTVRDALRTYERVQLAGRHDER